MATYRNATEFHLDVPLYDLHLAPGATFEVPDDVAASFDASPNFAKSRTSSPDATVTVDAVEAPPAASAN